MSYPSDTPMANDFNRSGPPQDEPRKKSWWPTCLVGCLVVFLIMIVLAVVAGYLIYTRGPDYLAEFGRKKITANIEQSELPEVEKQKIIREVDRVADAFKAREIGAQEMERAMRELAESPLMGMIVMAGVRVKYLEPSGLTDDEKQNAERTTQRIWRGVKEKKINMKQLESTFEIVATKKGEGQWQLKKSVTDEELRRFFAECKQRADEAQIPDEDFEISVGDEIKRIVDDVLGEG